MSPAPSARPSAAGTASAPCPPSAKAAFVRASGMAQDTAVAWLDAVHPGWERTWRRCGATLVAELAEAGRPDLVERLTELFGGPQARGR